MTTATLLRKDGRTATVLHVRPYLDTDPKGGSTGVRGVRRGRRSRARSNVSVDGGGEGAETNEAADVEPSVGRSISLNEKGREIAQLEPSETIKGGASGRNRMDSVRENETRVTGEQRRTCGCEKSRDKTEKL
jgi:hypothetical protein